VVCNAAWCYSEVSDGAAVPIRDDIPAEELPRLVRQESDGRVACRLLGLANVLDG
jgi:hypothetical protein